MTETKLTEALKETFTVDQLWALARETGSMTTPEISTLIHAAYRAIDLHNAGAVQRAMLAVGIAPERAALAAPGRTRVRPSCTCNHNSMSGGHADHCPLATW